jgi:hypothetical protein
MIKLNIRSVLEALSLLRRIVSAGGRGPMPYLIFFAVLGLLDMLLRGVFQVADGPWYVLFGIIYLCGFVISMVRLQRFVIHGLTYAPPGGFIGLWSISETRYLGYLLVLFCGAIVSVLLIATLSTDILAMAALTVPDQSSTTWNVLTGLLTFIIVLPLAYVIVRVSFVLPAASVQSPCGPLDAWALSRANGLQLTLVLGALIGIDFGLGYVTATLANPLRLLLKWANDFLSLIFWGLILALAYKDSIAEVSPLKAVLQKPAD